ncbi:MAG: Ig-like domain-containing protein [Bacteroidales bacterium]|nr:Ig-like domain-containing protein [Bacteroidales bacterium]
MKFRWLFSVLLITTTWAFGQNTWYIHNGGSNGDGSLSNPFNSWSSAMSALSAGDTLRVMPGTYYLTTYINPTNSGNSSERITIKAHDLSAKPVLKSTGTNIIRAASSVTHYTWEGIDMDGDFNNGANPLIQLRIGSDYWTFYNCKWYESHTDGLTVTESDHTVIDSCEVYYCVNHEAEGVRRDAHGIMFRSGNHMVVNNCNIHHNTGDCIQSGSSLTFPTWDSLIITNNHLWSGMLDTEVNTLPANTYWSENGIDTKTPDANEIANSSNPNWKAYIYIDNNVLHGFNGKHDWPAVAINMSVDATIKNTIVYESAIAFRLMGADIIAQTGTMSGPPLVTMWNCITYNTFWSSVWIEDDLDDVKIWNCTFDNSIDTLWWPGIHERAPSYFEARTNIGDDFDMRNCIFIDSVPPELNGLVGNTVYTASPADFTDYENHDYHLAFNSGAVNTGVNISEVETDIEGNPRISDHYDIGAYEADFSGPPVYVTDINISSQNGSAIIERPGETLQLTASVLPTNATLKTVTWSVINGSGEATISTSGLVSSVTPGIVTARATANDGSGIYDNFEITLQDPPVLVSEIIITASGGATSIDLPGESLQLTASVLPSNAANKSITWSMINGSGEATVSTSGLVTAISSGTVTARATANDGSGTYGNYSITILTPEYAVASINVTSAGGSSTIDSPGGTLQLIANILPVNAANQSVTWLMMNESGEATIDPSGLVTAVSAGTVTARAKANDGSGIFDDFTITILDAIISIESIYISVAEGLEPEVAVEQTLQLQAEIYPANATNKTVTWSIKEHSGKASIDVNGLVTGEVAGTVTAVALANDGTSEYDYLALTVLSPNSVIDPGSDSWEAGIIINYSYPYLSVRFENPDESYQSVSLYTMNGVLLLKQDLHSDDFEYEVSGFQPGLYFLEIRGEIHRKISKIVIY